MRDERLRADDPVVLPHLGNTGRLWAAVLDVADQRAKDGRSSAHRQSMLRDGEGHRLADRLEHGNELLQAVDPAYDKERNRLVEGRGGHGITTWVRRGRSGHLKADHD